MTFMRVPRNAKCGETRPGVKSGIVKRVRHTESLKAGALVHASHRCESSISGKRVAQPATQGVTRFAMKRPGERIGHVGVRLGSRTGIKL